MEITHNMMNLKRPTNVPHIQGYIMIRRELTLVNHRIEHLNEYQAVMEKNMKKKKKENMVLQV